MKEQRKNYDQIIVDVFRYCKELLQARNTQNQHFPVFNYSVEQLDEVINKHSKKIRKPVGERKKDEVSKISEAIELIKDQDALRDYYNNSLRLYFDANSTAETQNEILKSISLTDLRYMYSLISPLPLPASRKKAEILQLLRMYFENESRTRSLKI
ncbi:hypothetical protein [Paenibacillus daejeonensis]|uniref:hypothetical protein n=1 Tax=Paenibacillus daejeonensis TaxID=135193 RepID=UPI00037B7C88|nr:hypothetical protein [Paenibacillus daejeonensis]